MKPSFLTLGYFFEEELKNVSPFTVDSLTPIQMPSMDLEELFEQRKNFIKE